jgi:MFS family permease
MKALTAYFVSYGLSLLGNSIAAIALPLLLLATTGSLLGTGTLAIATAIPAVLAGVLGGVVIDRANRRTASIVADVISAASIGALPLVDLAADLNLGWFIALGLVGAIGDIPGMTAREALLPALVRSSGVSAERMLGLREALAAVVVLLGPALAGALILLLPGSAVLWITAATSFAAALASLFIPHEVGLNHDAPVAQASAHSLIAELREGLGALFVRSPFLLSVTMLSLLLIAVFATLQGLVLPAHFTVIDEQGTLGFVLSALAAGTLAGGSLYAVAGMRLQRRTWFVAGLLGATAGIAMLASLGPTWLILAGGVVLGFALGPLSALLGVLMIERIPEALRGRIMGMQNSLVTVAAPIALFGTALFAEAVGLAAAAALLAGLWALGVMAALVAPGLRDLGPQGEQDTEGEVVLGA